MAQRLHHTTNRPNGKRPSGQFVQAGVDKQGDIVGAQSWGPSSNSPPAIIVPLTTEQADFRNCEANISLGLSLLQDANRSTAIKVVDMIEQFKSIKGSIRVARESP